MTTESRPQRVRVVVCRGQYCNSGRRGDHLYNQLQRRIDELSRDVPIKLEMANCLSMCGAGPNIVVYPEGTIYHQVTPAMLTAIIENHFLSRQQPSP